MWNISGSNFGTHVCDCHYEEAGCAEEQIYENTCNCDANLPVEMTDTGTITNTSALPIVTLYFGGLNYDQQYGAFQLGRLKCYGKNLPPFLFTLKHYNIQVRRRLRLEHPVPP